VSLVDGQDKDGKAVKIPHVKPVGADDKTAAVPMADWFKNNAAYLLPALNAKPSATGTNSTAQGAAGTQNNGGGSSAPAYVDQSGGGGGTANGASGTRAAIPGRPKFLTPAARAQAKTGGSK